MTTPTKPAIGQTYNPAVHSVPVPEQQAKVDPALVRQLLALPDLPRYIKASLENSDSKVQDAGIKLAKQWLKDRKAERELAEAQRIREDRDDLVAQLQAVSEELILQLEHLSKQFASPLGQANDQELIRKVRLSAHPDQLIRLNGKLQKRIDERLARAEKPKVEPVVNTEPLAWLKVNETKGQIGKPNAQPSGPSNGGRAIANAGKSRTELARGKK
jgi:hypothetical protein